MDLRRLVRGTIPWHDLETVATELRRRYDKDEIRIEFLDADNWLSTPCVADGAWFVKIVSPQNALVHALFTGARNLGAVTSGSRAFFEQFDDPHEMARHELEATRKLRSIGVNAPEPVEAFQVGSFGILVLEYLPNFRTLDDLDQEAIAEVAPELFEALSTMHDHHLAHGDLRGENVLIYDDELYFIDVTNVSDDGIEGALAYDLASALATLSRDLSVRTVVDVALEEYSIEDLLAARSFIDIVRLRPDHDFDTGALKGEIEKRASRDRRH